MANYITNNQLDQLTDLTSQLDKNFEDTSKAYQISCDMLKVLGIEPMTAKKFNELLDSDEPLVLF